MDVHAILPRPSYYDLHIFNTAILTLNLAALDLPKVKSFYFNDADHLCHISWKLDLFCAIWEITTNAVNKRMLSCQPVYQARASTTARDEVEGSCRPRAWYMGWYKNSRVITSLLSCFCFSLYYVLYLLQSIMANKASCNSSWWM